VTHSARPDAEAWLASLAPIGWRFGLDRIRRLVSVLGMPQHRFTAVHVVGTNGKSSVAQMAAALLEARGLRTGTYLSPHERRWSERVHLGGVEIGEEEFAAAAERVADAVEVVDRALDEGERVTQFEAATAIAFAALAAARVEVGVIEAGLGGRLDATNVLASKVTALTSVGLEHTQWLGDTEVEIAGEKLAVLRDHSTLVLGRVGEEVAALAWRTAAERHAELLVASELAPELQVDLPGPYQRRNLAVAIAAAEIVAGPLAPELVAGAIDGLELPGRMEVHRSEPPSILDAAHNPDGARALAEALPEVEGDRPVVACLAVLADKDVDAIVAALAPRIEAMVATEIPAERLRDVGRPDSAAVSTERLARAARAAGIATVEEVTDPAAAVRRARELAAERAGVALISGSHYLLPYGS
jgi:dihydrofolate synthase/folylpolyglutamate synthase